MAIIKTRNQLVLELEAAMAELKTVRNPKPRKISKELRAWRAKHDDMPRPEAAEHLGIAVRTLENLENGRPTPNGHAMLAVARLYDLCADLRQQIEQTEDATVGD